MSNLVIQFKRHFRYFPIKIRLHTFNHFIQMNHIDSQRLHIILALNFTLGRSFDMTQQIRFVLLEFVMIESNVGCGPGIVIGSQNGFGFEFAKSIKV